MKVLKSRQTKIIFCEKNYIKLLQMGYDPTHNVCFVPMIFFVDDYPLNTQNALISPHTFLNYLKLLADSDTFSATQQQFQSHPKTLLKENEFIFSHDENMSNTIKIIGMKYENQIRFVWKFLGNKRGIKHKRISRKYGTTQSTLKRLSIFLIFSTMISTILSKNTEI